MTEDHMADLRGVDAAAFHRGLGHDRAKIAGCVTGQGAAESADRGARAGQYYDIFHHVLLM